ncbi:unnamed protein product [Sympodiomycopsis kandeliae]
MVNTKLPQYEGFRSEGHRTGHTAQCQCARAALFQTDAGIGRVVHIVHIADEEAQNDLWITRIRVGLVLYVLCLAGIFMFVGIMIFAIVADRPTQNATK